ncbi:MAG: quinone-dependent dihydroorotate dehydrogenase [Porticoccaceae bacterium]
MYQLLRSALFRLPPETSHELSLKSLRAGERIGLLGCLARRPQACAVRLMGLDFQNPVGLSAGLDKNGDYFNALGALGFGFIEIGTVTPRPQPGNSKPRLFRLPEHAAIINRLGFNNLGVDYLVEQAAKRRFDGILGINIGKNADTPLARAAEDYLMGMEKVYRHADYIAVNISSPNTPGLRDLQLGDSLAQLLGQLKDAQRRLADRHARYVPLAVKIAPDLDAGAIVDIAALLIKYAIDGVIATNTTLSRDGIEESSIAGETGGLSGAPLRTRATKVIAVLAKALDGALPIIGVGGIMSGEDAAEKIAAGASLVQIYTGFIYRGPRLVGEAVDAIRPLVASRSLDQGLLGAKPPG